MDQSQGSDEGKPLQFHEMGIDDRLLKAIAKLGWAQPTLIQEKAIPLLLDGKDVLIRARTGSGKTGAFAIPIIQKILQSKETSLEPCTKALILAPTKELCHQLSTNFLQLTIKCSREVEIVDISPQVDLKAQRVLLNDKPDVIVATPARALMHLKAGYLSLVSMKTLVIDEADLIFSFGYSDDIKEIVKYLPKIYQGSLASATLSEDIISLKRLFLRNTVTLRLEEPSVAPITQLRHTWLEADEEGKATALYTLLKLALLQGKTIIFVNTVDKCYKLKLFLEQFGIQSCVLNSELPAVIRCHSVTQFNEGVYDIIIASDELALEKISMSQDSKKPGRKKDKESGVSRGIDFQFVANVVNFDFPLDVNSYIHRAGRTARGTNKGTVLSFISIHERSVMELIDDYLKANLGETNSVFQKYEFKLEEVEGFRYRAKDAWRATTRIAVREARLKEIKSELFNSQRLKGYFEDNPRDLRSLRHDKALHTVKVQSHLSNVPDYLVPASLKAVVDLSQVRRRRKRPKPIAPSSLKYKARRSNPLLSLELPDSIAKTCS